MTLTRAMSTSLNAFGLLSGAGGDAGSAPSANAAKNRRKKERRKQGKVADSAGENRLAEEAEADRGSTAPSHSVNAASKRYSDSAEDLASDLQSEARSSDCWPVWDAWLRKVRDQDSVCACRVLSLLYHVQPIRSF